LPLKRRGVSLRGAASELFDKKSSHIPVSDLFLVPAAPIERGNAAKIIAGEELSARADRNQGLIAPRSVRENCRIFVGRGFSRAVKPAKSVRL
jgi:hypothetical protein